MSVRQKILFFMDQPALKHLLAEPLQKSRYELCYARGEAAQEVFEKLPHLIVIDQDFQNGEGKTIARCLKEDLVLKYIPIILLVNTAEPMTQKEIGTIDIYLEKSKNSEPFMSSLRNALSRNYHELDLNPLTHLPGIRSTVLRLEHAAASKKPFAVCSIDLTDLSIFNDAYGDIRGDQIIVKLSKLIQEVLKKQGLRDDFLGHLGGDDFVIVTQPEAAISISEAIIAKFDESILSFYDPKDRKLGYIIQKTRDGVMKQYPLMSVSIAVIQSDTAFIADISEVGHIAAELKKKMKAVPGSCYFKYQPDNSENGEQTPVSRQHKPGVLTQRYGAIFRSILKNKKIRTVYQPIVDLRLKTVIGYEALTRVTEDGPLSNAVLLFEVARDCGDLKEFDELCAQCALQSAQSMDRGKKLFINLNYETLMDSRVIQKIFTEKGSIPFEDLVIEVTEQSILRSFDKLKRALSELKEQGAHVAIDDVGGGAVSLRDVAILRPDFMKFDRSLIRQIDKSITKQQIVLSMILFANGIHATTTAEGIETRGECEAVRMCGFSLGQGYFFARPGEPFPEISAF